MDLHEHLGLSSCASAAIYLATGDLGAAAAFLATGVFIDLDHVHDYWRDTGFNLHARRFFAHFPNRGPSYLLLALHAWEWPLTLLALALAVGAPAWVFALAAGWFSHLVLDQRYNLGQKPLCYFFIYRFRQGFLAEAFYDGEA